MPSEPLPDFAIVLTFLRSGQGWSQAELAEAAGIPVKLLNNYERGRKNLTRNRLEQLIAWMGFTPETLDDTLHALAANRAAARAPAGPEGARAESRRRIEAISSQVGRLFADVSRQALTLLTVEGKALHDRERAETVWARLRKKTPADRLLLVEKSRDFRSWALCERIVAESLQLAPNHPRDSRELARLAVRLAELAPVEERFRQRLQGYALAALSNAERVCNDLPAAEAAFARARFLWEEGTPGDPGLLNAALVPWIEAALHRAHRRFREALKSVEHALALDNGKLRGKILLSKSAIFQILGQAEGSTAALIEATPLIHSDREPRDAWGLRFNLAVDLCQLGRFQEAEQRVPEVRALAERMGEELDLTRVVWLEGKVAAGLGRTEEAKAAFEQARHKLRSEELVFDYALVSLDVALVHLKEGKVGQVKCLAEEMLWIFKSQGVHREALAALGVFCEAARQEAATVQLTRSISKFLQRAKLDPILTYELEARAEAP